MSIANAGPTRRRSPTLLAGGRGPRPPRPDTPGAGDRPSVAAGRPTARDSAHARSPGPSPADVAAGMRALLARRAAELERRGHRRRVEDRLQHAGHPGSTSASPAPWSGTSPTPPSWTGRRPGRPRRLAATGARGGGGHPGRRRRRRRPRWVPPWSWSTSISPSIDIEPILAGNVFHRGVSSAPSAPGPRRCAELAVAVVKDGGGGGRRASSRRPAADDRGGRRHDSSRPTAPRCVRASGSSPARSSRRWPSPRVTGSMSPSGSSAR